MTLVCICLSVCLSVSVCVCVSVSVCVCERERERERERETDRQTDRHIHTNVILCIFIYNFYSKVYLKCNFIFFAGTLLAQKHRTSQFCFYTLLIFCFGSLCFVFTLAARPTLYAQAYVPVYVIFWCLFK